MARQMNEEEFAKFLGTFVQAVWQQLVQVSQRPGQARASSMADAGKFAPNAVSLCGIPQVLFECDRHS